MPSVFLEIPQIASFHTADAIEEFFADNRANGLVWLANNPIDIEGIRPYQEEAISAIEDAIAKGKRSMLIAMATGTGKTFLTVSQIYRLLASKAARRILFLVDRRALAAQAVREFATFVTPLKNKFNQEYEVYSQRFRRDDLEDDKPFDPKVLPDAYLTSPQDSHTFVYVSTIQRMTINLFGPEYAFSQNQNDPDYEDDAGKIYVPIHAFDVIIADECHRRYTAKDTAIWRQVLDHFDAIKIGLTATPALHTLSLFKEVIYRYTTEEAILDGWLVDHEAVKIKSDVRMKAPFSKKGSTSFDCFDGTLIEYFKNTTDFEVRLPEKEAISLAQVIENIYQNIDRDYFVKVLVKRLRRIDRAMSGNARKEFARYIPDGDMGRFAEKLPESIRNDFTNAMKLLLDKDFQELLLNYERAKRQFLVGYEVEDDVSSEVMIRVGSDYQKPEDYLDAFARFVRENPEQIEAIRVVLERPKDWKTGALKELREKLALNRFPEIELRKAHRLVYHKAPADIISMVKHAARAEEPIYSAEERVDQALTKVTADKTFTEEQMKWLGYIREHLLENLTIDLDDFNVMPTFELHGGIAKAKKVFDNKLETLIAEINYAIAA